MLNGQRTSSALLLALALVGCRTVEPILDVAGSCADVNQGQVCVSAKTQGTAILEVGLTVPMASIENAPAEVPMAWPPATAAMLDLPADVQQLAGLTHFTMYWEPGGHPPAPFMQPHFDFHFYMVPTADRMAIDCKDLSKPTELPATYALPDIELPPDMAKMLGGPALIGLCVPQMGMHSLPAAELDGTQPFTGDMVIGYYKAKPIFVEPMLTKAMLMEQRSFDLTIPTIPGLVGPHPTKFHAEFDAAKREYRFAFSGFAQ